MIQQEGDSQLFFSLFYCHLLDHGNVFHLQVHHLLSQCWNLWWIFNPLFLWLTCHLSLLIEDLCGKNLFSKILNVQKMLEKEKEAVRNELLFKEKVFLNSGSPERTVEHLWNHLWNSRSFSYRSIMNSSSFQRFSRTEKNEHDVNFFVLLVLLQIDSDGNQESIKLTTFPKRWSAHRQARRR